MFIVVFGFQGTDSIDQLSSVSGDGEIRTHDPLLARQVLSQLSYTPKFKSVNLIGFCLFFSSVFFKVLYFDWA